jgi:hypothetical protein
MHSLSTNSKMTLSTLKEAYSTKLQVELFNQRHGPKRVTSLPLVLEAMKRLGLVGQPYPPKDEAEAMVKAIQTELESITP